MQPPEVFCKSRCSLKFRKLYRKAPVLESVFNKVAGLETATLLKRHSNTDFSSEVCKIFRSTYFKEHLRTTAPENSSYRYCIFDVSY